MRPIFYQHVLACINLSADIRAGLQSPVPLLSRVKDTSTPAYERTIRWTSKHEKKQYSTLVRVRQADIHSTTCTRVRLGHCCVTTAELWTRYVLTRTSISASENRLLLIRVSQHGCFTQRHCCGRHHRYFSQRVLALL